jgi:hypothetical protein
VRTRLQVVGDGVAYDDAALQQRRRFPLHRLERRRVLDVRRPAMVQGLGSAVLQICWHLAMGGIPTSQLPG